MSANILALSSRRSTRNFKFFYKSNKYLNSFLNHIFIHYFESCHTITHSEIFNHYPSIAGNVTATPLSKVAYVAFT